MKKRKEKKSNNPCKKRVSFVRIKREKERICVCVIYMCVYILHHGGRPFSAIYNIYFDMIDPLINF